MAHFYFNTAFISGNQLVMKKPEIDKVVSDKKHKKYHPDFEIHLDFEGAEHPVLSANGLVKPTDENGSKKLRKYKNKKEKKEKKEKKAKRKQSQQKLIVVEDDKKEEEKKEEEEKVEPKEDTKKEDIKNGKEDVIPEPKK